MIGINSSSDKAITKKYTIIVVPNTEPKPKAMPFKKWAHMADQIDEFIRAKRCFKSFSIVLERRLDCRCSSSGNGG
mgnify:CR=1 FL=1